MRFSVNTTLTFQTFVDNIERNVSSIATDTQEASQQLTTAADYQRRAGRRAACLMLIVAVVVAVVLLAVRSHDAGTSLTLADVCIEQLFRSFLDSEIPISDARLNMSTIILSRIHSYL